MNTAGVFSASVAPLTKPSGCPPIRVNPIISVFGFGWRHVTDGLEQPLVVEPVDPFQCRVFDGFEGSPRPPPMDDLGLVEAVDGFGQGVVIAVADTADRRLDAGLGEALRVLDRQLAAADALLIVKRRSGLG